MYQIDQSGKIENTNKTTIVALSNSVKKTIKISATEKQSKLKPTIIVKAEEILEIFYAKEKGWRSRSRRDNP